MKLTDDKIRLQCMIYIYIYCDNNLYHHTKSWSNGKTLRLWLMYIQITLWAWYPIT